MNEEDREVVLAMGRYGGSFVSALAEAAYRADPKNLQKIKDAWPEYWLQYSELAKSLPKSTKEELPQ